MRILLDSHVWLWMLSTPERLNEQTRAALGTPTNEVILSVASVWEVAVKHALHKLPFPASPPALVDVSVRRFALKLLPISVDHALAAANLPGHHKDPFDRMLIAQAVVEDLTFATADGRIRMYEVARLWAT